MTNGTTHLHAGYGIAGYGPDGADGFATFNTAEELAAYLHEELRGVEEWIDDHARTLASELDFRGAWEAMERAEAVELLRANLNPARANAPLYRDDLPLWRETIERTVAESFPLDTVGATRLYVWDCAEAGCEHCDDDGC